MKITRGWWTLKANLELNDIDKRHIGDLIEQGYTEGELIHEEGD